MNRLLRSLLCAICLCALLAGIGAMEEFFRSIHMPVSLTELGVHPTDEEYKELAHKAAVASPTGTLGSVMKLQEADMEAIFRAAQ